VSGGRGSLASFLLCWTSEDNVARGNRVLCHRYYHVTVITTPAGGSFSQTPTWQGAIVSISFRFASRGTMSPAYRWLVVLASLRDAFHCAYRNRWCRPLRGLNHRLMADIPAGWNPSTDRPGDNRVLCHRYYPRPLWAHPQGAAMRHKLDDRVEPRSHVGNRVAWPAWKR